MERGIYRNSGFAVTAAADNAIDTLTLAASSGMAYMVFGLHAEYSAAVASKKALTLAFTNEAGDAITVTWELDFNLSRAQDITFPLPIRGQSGTEITVTLAASGAGGVTGRISPYWTSV